MTEVVVTLQMDGFSRDFSLPADIKLRELYPRLLNALQHVSGSRFADWKGVLLKTNEGAFVDLEATLLDYGVCTGKYLVVVEEAWDDGIG
ncbi:MAG: hypothetical protein E7454_05690 [Ruminococcaceae bacterium]|nr:hypothetical protein [Oscillospiraceae bacterium]